MALPRAFLTIQLIFVLCYAFVHVCALNNVNAKRGSRKHDNFMRGLFSTALRLSGMRDTWHGMSRESKIYFPFDHENS